MEAESTIKNEIKKAIKFNLNHGNYINIHRTLNIKIILNKYDYNPNNWRDLDLFLALHLIGNTNILCSYNQNTMNELKYEFGEDIYNIINEIRNYFIEQHEVNILESQLLLLAAAMVDLVSTKVILDKRPFLNIREACKNSDKIIMKDYVNLLEIKKLIF